MIELLGAIVAILGILVSLTAFFVVVGLLFPARIAEIYAVADSQPGRSLLIGSVNFLFFGVVGLASIAVADNSGIGLLALPGLIIGAALSIGLVFGITGMAHLVGDRLLSESSQLRRPLWGGISMTLACLLPFVGWFVLFPYVALVGLGALLISQSNKRRQRKLEEG